MPDPKIKFNRKINRDLTNPLSPSAFDKFTKEQRKAVKGVMKGGVSATNLAAGLKGKKAEAAKKSGTSVKQAKAKRKAVRTAASVGRPKRVADKEIKKALSKRLKTKTPARGKKVVEKIDKKRHVTKYTKGGNIRKAKGMGYKTKHKAGKIVKEKGRNK